MALVAEIRLPSVQWLSRNHTSPQITTYYSYRCYSSVQIAPYTVRILLYML